MDIGQALGKVSSPPDMEKLALVGFIHSKMSKGEYTTTFGSLDQVFQKYKGWGIWMIRALIDDGIYDVESGGYGRGGYVIIKYATNKVSGQKMSDYQYHKGDPPSIRMAYYIYTKMVKHQPGIIELKKALSRKWADDCRLMLEVDGRSGDDIKKVIDFAYEDEWWVKNTVLSPKNIRKHYDKLMVRVPRNIHTTKKVWTPD